MEFSFVGSMYVSENDLEEICSLVKDGMSVQDAIREVATGWDDYDYYVLDYVEDNIIIEINNRLEIEEVE